MAPTAVDVLPFIAGLRGPAQCTCFDRGAVVDAREGATIHAVCRRGGGTTRYTLPSGETYHAVRLTLPLPLSLPLTLGRDVSATMWSYTAIVRMILPTETPSFLRSTGIFQSRSAPSASRHGSPTWSGRCSGDIGLVLVLM